MRRDKQIVLLDIVPNPDSAFEPPIETHEHAVLATENSITRSEFYFAASTDFNPEISFTVWLSDYHGESHLIYNQIRYTIFRTFKRNEKEIDVICTKYGK